VSQKELAIKTNYLHEKLSQAFSTGENGRNEQHEALNIRKVPDTKYPRCNDEQTSRLKLFHLPTLRHNSLFINNMYVTLLSSTCFEH